MSTPHAPRGRDARLTLYLPSGPESGGFFTVSPAEGIPVTVKCNPAHAHVLLALDRARQDDADLVADARGWRRPEQLADAVSRVTGYLVEPQTIRAYLSQIRRLVREAMEEECPEQVPPPLFEHKRLIGARLLGDGLEVVIGPRGST